MNHQILTMKQTYKNLFNNRFNLLLQKFAIVILVSVFFIPLACNKKDANYYYKQGNIQFRLKAYDEALNLYTQAVTISPDFEEAFYSRAFCYTKKKDYNKAIDDFSKVIEINPKNAGAFINRAFYARERIGDFAGAVKDYDQAISLLSETNSAFALNNRGHAKYMLQDTLGAITDINRSLEIDPENPYAYRNRAIVLLATGQTNEACKDLMRAKELGYEQLYGNDINELTAKYCR